MFNSNIKQLSVSLNIDKSKKYIFSLQLGNVAPIQMNWETLQMETSTYSHMSCQLSLAFMIHLGKLWSLNIVSRCNRYSMYFLLLYRECKYSGRIIYNGTRKPFQTYLCPWAFLLFIHWSKNPIPFLKTHLDRRVESNISSVEGELGNGMFVT